MNKIGIITILNVNNYGAELQAFALNHKLGQLGYDSEIINYLFYKNPEYVFESKSKPIFKIKYTDKLKDYILGRLDRYSQLSNGKIAKVRLRRFNEFHNKLSKVSSPIKSISELYTKELNYDTYVVGSDQVWNPNNQINIEPYFLTFAPNNKKKIAYASSFGVGKIEKENLDSFKKLLNNIDVLSCREESGVQLIKDITNRVATHVLDPTLLLSKKEWEDISVPFEETEPYILLFIFKNSEYVTNFALDLQKKTGYKIIRICKNEMRVESDRKILNIRDAGPREFLGIYQKATIVITTSFHGSIFSLIFKKPFYTITPNRKNNNTRQQSLLRMVGLEDRLIMEGADFPNKVDIEIDFNPVQKIIESEKNISINYLVNALGRKS
jgi:polysaccharide pyruvyl transferase WcaK-like protein